MILMMLALSVSPVEMDVLWPQKMEMLHVENVGSEPTAFQIQVFKWSRMNGVERLTETKNIVATPPMIQEARSQKKQSIRVMRVSTKPVIDEESYRVIVHEIPKRKLLLQKNQVGAQLVSSFSLPVFFTNPKATPKLVWIAQRKKNRLILKGINEGSKHITILSLTVPSLSMESNTYHRILKKSSEEWVSKPILKGFEVGKTITLTLKTGDGFLDEKATIVSAH